MTILEAYSFYQCKKSEENYFFSSLLLRQKVELIWEIAHIY